MYAIDQYVMRGVGLRCSTTHSPNPRFRHLGRSLACRSSDLGNLLEAGVAIDTSKFVGDRQHAVRVRFEFQAR